MGFKSMATGGSVFGFPLSGQWNFRTDTGTTPASGRLNFDNVVAASVTTVYVNEVDAQGNDRTLMLQLLEDNQGPIVGIVPDLGGEFLLGAEIEKARSLERRAF